MTDTLVAPADINPGSLPEPPAPEVPKVEASILGSLRAARAKLGAGADPILVDIPGYEGQLVGRFKWIPLSELSKTSQSLSRITEPTEQAVASAADAVVAMCSEILVRIDGDLHPLSTDEAPVTFKDPRLAYALGFDDPQSARALAIRSFANEYALIETAADLVEWLKDTSKKIDSDFLGK